MARKTDVGHAGKTVLYVRILLNQHLSTISNVIGIEKTGNGDKIYRETKESLWIKKLKTFEPLGLNIKVDQH
jgi:hypothetical protein